MKDILLYSRNIFFTEREQYILVFRTDIKFKKDIKVIAAVLNKKAGILNWNIDQSDIDRVLRIESTINNSTEIISTIREAGYFCEELPG